MHVFVLIPVHNRVEHTKKVIECLRRQTLKSLSIIIIDDGSTDSTPDFLSTCHDVITLQGNGTLWWAGAMALGLSHIIATASKDDFVLFLNNDTLFDPGYVQTLLNTSYEIGQGVVGSVLRNVKAPHEVLSIGPVIDIWGMRVWDKWQDMTPYERVNLAERYDVMAVSGRGTLYPIRVLDQIGGLRPRLLPHYYADYELGMRAARHGFPVVVSTKSVIYSENDFSVKRKPSGLIEKYFGERSYKNLLRVTIFWSSVGSPFERGTALPRLAYQALSRKFRNVLKFMLRRLPLVKQGYAVLKKVRYARHLRNTIRARQIDLRIIVGASSTSMPDWISTEYPYVNVANGSNLAEWFSPASVKAILAEHVWEHLTADQAQSAVQNCMVMLKPGGYLRIAVPDGSHPDKEYIDYVRPGGRGEGSDDHRVLYTLESLSLLLRDAGFEVVPLEWFDSNGQFHMNPWDPAKGMINRSTRFDLRNHSNPIAYTSLIVDAIKPVIRPGE